MINVNKTYNINSRVILKKPHACGSNEWIVTRTGVDVKIKCASCNHEIMMDRLTFEKKIKNVLGDKNA